MTTPPHQQLHVCEPTDAQLQLAKRIAAKTRKTVAQVLAEAISRGTSAQLSAAISGQSMPVRAPR